MISGCVVIAYAKILILKQVTTSGEVLHELGGCYCLCKDTNSQASHNSANSGSTPSGVVIAYAKILILKQVTTPLARHRAQARCYCLCKDTNSQASHNSVVSLTTPAKVVIAYAKILILKQVTTTINGSVLKNVLLLPMQRY